MTSASLEHPGKSAGFSDGFVLEVILASTSGANGGYTVQRITYVARNAIYCRIRSTSAWSSWQRIDNFGCNSLSELKVALAAV